MSSADASTSYSASLQRIVSDLQLDGVRVSGHDLRASGDDFSATLEVGLEKIRFDWDSASETLMVLFPDPQEPGQWKEDARISLPQSEGVFAEIYSETFSLLGP